MTRAFWVWALAIALISPAIVRADDTKPDTKPAAKDGTSPPKKEKEKGRLPAYYAKIVDESQKEKIYQIENEYAPKLKELTAQLKALNDEREQKIRAVLTADQQKKLDEVLADAKNRKRGGDKADVKPKTDAKPDATKPANTKLDATPAKPAAATVPTK
jgi:hypothetical protein